MRAIGIRLLEVIKLKYLFASAVFFSILFSQFNIDKITHPLNQPLGEAPDSTESYILINSINNFGLGEMLYDYNHYVSYHDTFSGYNLTLS